MDERGFHFFGQKFLKDKFLMKNGWKVYVSNICPNYPTSYFYILSYSIKHQIRLQLSDGVTKDDIMVGIAYSTSDPFDLQTYQAFPEDFLKKNNSGKDKIKIEKTYFNDDEHYLNINIKCDLTTNIKDIDPTPDSIIDRLKKCARYVLRFYIFNRNNPNNPIFLEPFINCARPERLTHKIRLNDELYPDIFFKYDVFKKTHKSRKRLRDDFLEDHYYKNDTRLAVFKRDNLQYLENLKKEENHFEKYYYSYFKRQRIQEEPVLSPERDDSSERSTEEQESEERSNEIDNIKEDIKYIKSVLGAIYNTDSIDISQSNNNQEIIALQKRLTRKINMLKRMER